MKETILAAALLFTPATSTTKQYVVDTANPVVLSITTKQGNTMLLGCHPLITEENN